jgi:hypothetical protein
MEEEQRLDELQQGVGPVIETPNVGRFVKHNLVEFGGIELIEQSAGYEDGGLKESNHNRDFGFA